MKRTYPMPSHLTVKRSPISKLRYRGIGIAHISPIFFCITSFIFYRTVRVVLSVWFYRRGNQDSELLSHLFNAIQLASVRAGT